MQKKHCLLIVAFVFMLGPIVASLPIAPVKAQDTVRFYVYPSLISAVAPGGYINFEVWIESPQAWDDTADGIVGWALSVRGDPRALEPSGAGKIGGMGGFLEDFLVEYWYDWDYSTSFLSGEKDLATCTFFDISEYIMGYETLGKGAGGNGKLARFRFKSRSDTIASVIDLFGPPRPPIIEIMAIYTTPDGVDHYVDVLDDGYYIGETPDITFFDLTAWASVIGSTWHEVWPEPCREWTIDSHEDTNENGELDPSEQIDMTCLPTGYYGWYHVEWVNPTPVAGDGKADLIVKFKEEVPEFPLGLEIIMMIAAAIPIIYIWRTRKWAGKK